MGILGASCSASATRDAPTAAAITVKSVPSMLMVNRNAGSGTRILPDRLPGNTRPDGYAYQTRSHTAVAVTQSLVNWGIAIASVAHAYGLGFQPLQPEPYGWAVPRARLDRPAVQRFITVLHGAPARAALRPA